MQFDGNRGIEVIHELLGAHRLSEALPLCQALVDSDPSNATAWGLLGFCQLHLRMPEVALTSLSKAASFDPGNAEHLLWLGATYVRLRDPAPALMVLQRAIAIDPECAAAWFYLASVSLGDDRARAQAAARRAVDLQPENEDHHIVLSRALLEGDGAQEAHEHSMAAVKLNESRPSGWYVLSESLKRLGRLEDAICAFRSGLDRDTDHTADGLAVFAGLLIRGGYFKEARRVLTTADRLDPGNEEIAAMLESLPRLPGTRDR